MSKCRDYIKCAVRNRCVLASYVGFGLGLGMYPIAIITQSIELQVAALLTSFVSGTGGLLGTFCGTSTYEVYTRTKNHIEKFGTIDKRFQRRIEKDYCPQIGLKMAAEEAGLEDLLV